METGIWGAYRNVLINLPGIKDQEFLNAKKAEAEAIVNRAYEKCAICLEILQNRTGQV